MWKLNMASSVTDKCLIACINFYQVYVSPYKGFRCAHATYHKDIPCSSWARTIVENDGWLTFLLSLKSRAHECRKAERALSLGNIEHQNSKNKDNVKPNDNKQPSKCEESASCCIWLIPW
jgi:uncharacterized protein